MQDPEGAVEQMDQVGGSPARSSQRLRPLAAQPGPTQPMQYQRLKRPRSSASAKHSDDEDCEEQLLD